MATYNGTSANNTIYGSAYADTINGYGGNDLLYGRAGNDTINAGDGDDSLWGEQGNDILYGNAGNDKIYASDGNDILWGGSGSDSLYGDAGSDTLKGEAGNDVLKGGSGILYAYAGTENDTIVYDPTTANIASFGSYLSGSILNGDAGTDTLQIFNHAVYTEGTATKAAATSVFVDYNGTAYIRFKEQGTEYGELNVSVGTAKGVEKITISGNGGLDYESDWYGNVGKDITGTAVADSFRSGYASDTMRGGGGNDTFHFGGGIDTIYSESADADKLYFDFYGEGNATVKGFNGAGTLSGDKIYLEEDLLFDGGQPGVSYTNGNTVFTLNSSNFLVVEGVDLRQGEGIDWFLI